MCVTFFGVGRVWGFGGKKEKGREKKKFGVVTIGSSGLEGVGGGGCDVVVGSGGGGRRKYERMWGWRRCSGRVGLQLVLVHVLMGVV